MGDTTPVTCAGCGTENQIMTPGDDGWEAVTVTDPSVPGRTVRIVGHRLTVRCPACGDRTVLNREES